MIDRKFVNKVAKVAATIAVSGMMIAPLSEVTWAATTLNNGQTVNGVIRANSPAFRFRNDSKRGAPLEIAAGDEYVFNAQQGDTIQVSVTFQNAGQILPILVLTNSRTGRQVAFNNRNNSLRYQVPTSGEYKLLVLAQNNSRGRYSVSVSGINQGGGIAQNPSTPTTTTDQKRQFLQNEYGLRLLDTCPQVRSSLVVVAFQEFGQTSTYCANPSRLVKAGEYVYDSASNEIKPVGFVGQTTSTQTTDRRKEFLQNEYGLRVLDTCPQLRNSVVAVTFTEYGQTSTYCANPSRLVKAGEYVYDTATNEIRPAGSVAQNPSSQATDQRKQMLLSEYGLRVLDTCPPVTSSLVVVTFREYGQTYTYCANPNRAVAAGEYTYDVSNNELRPTGNVAQTPSQDERRRILQNEFGLTVLDTCPAVKTSVVSVSFTDTALNSTSVCANPNRVFPAGEYTYNTSTRTLDSATKPRRCTVEVGGICLVK
jgi:hypothetical protein